MRGLAVLLVYCVHFVSTSKPWQPPNGFVHDALDRLHHVGNFGVDLFFVLSGYLIYGNLISKPQAFPAFMQRRVRRIYPVFAIVLLIYLCLSFLIPSASKLPEDSTLASIYILSNFLLLPGMLPIKPIITVAWSLSYEAFFYLITPFMIWLLKAHQKRPAVRVRIWLALGAALIGYNALFGGGYPRLALFFAGMVVFEVGLASRPIAPRHVGAAGLALALSVPWLFNDVSGTFWWQLAAASLGLMAFCHEGFTRPTSWTARAMSWQPLRWLGNMSYSFYLIHSLALHVTASIFGAVAPAGPGLVALVLFFLFGFLLAGVLSATLFVLVELPYSLRRTRPSLSVVSEAA